MATAESTKSASRRKRRGRRGRTKRIISRDNRRALRKLLLAKKKELKSLYGDAADKLFMMAVTGPRYLKSITDGKFRSSRATLDYLIAHADKIDRTKLARVLGESHVSKASRKSKKTSKGNEAPESNDATPKSNEAPESRSTGNRTTHERPSNSSSRRSSTEPPSDNSESISVPEVVSEPAPAEPAQSNTASHGRTSNKDEVLAACYQVFGANRHIVGRTHMHLDPKGYPTIGCGHLVWKKGTDKAAARRSYISAMTSIGISSAQAGRDFDTAVGHVSTQTRSGVNVIVSPREITITEEQAKKLFIHDATKKYEQVKKKCPQLSTYPLEVQIALIRTVYHGLPVGGKNMQDIVRNMANAWCAEARRGGTKVNVKRGTQVAVACIAAGVEMPSLIAEAWNSEKGIKHYNSDIAPAIGKPKRAQSTSSRSRRRTSHSGGRGSR